MNRLNIRTGDMIRYAALGLALLGLVVLYVFEFKYFNLTLNLRGLIFKGLVAGLILGLVLGRLYYKQGRDLTERIQLYVFFVVLSMVFMPLFVSLSNRLLSFKPPSSLSVEYVGTEAYFSDRFGVTKGQQIKPTGYNLFFYHDNQLKKIRLDYPLFQDSLRGAMITLPVRAGLWGHKVILPDRLGETGI